MRIISKNHDYYDTVMVHGVDPTCVYVREPIELDKKSNNYNTIINNQDIKNILNSFPYLDMDSNHKIFLKLTGIIIFCGYLFPFLEFIYNRKECIICFNTKNVDEMFDNCSNKNIKEKYYFKNDKFSYLSYFRRVSKKRIEQVFSNSNKKLNNLDIHYNTNSPIILIQQKRNLKNRNNSENYISINPNLKSFSFYKIKDAYTTYQELSQFVCGILKRTDPNVVELKDLDKLEKHGFDKVTSFRNMK